jgi:hypothetical protein
MNIFHGQIFAVRKLSFIYAHEAFLELLIVVSCGIIYGAHAAVQTARGQEPFINLHTGPP